MKLLLVCALFLVGTLAERARFDNYQVHRVVPKTSEDLKILVDLQHDNDYNFWAEPSGIDRTVDIMVPPHKRAEFEELIQETGMERTVTIEDVQRLVDDELGSVSLRSKALEWSNYHTLEEFEAWMTDLTKTYKNVKPVVVGSTYEKRQIKGIEITFGDNYTTVFIESGIHAREWIAAAATSYVVNELLKSPADSVWRKFNYIYVPFYNPDGYAYTWSTNRMWRKTRTPYKSGSRTCYGADPNRNWGYHWNEGGCSNDPCTEIYCGPKAFSEVETKTISEYLTKVAKPKKIDLYLAYHSYSQLIMYPWGYTPKPAPLAKLWQRVGEAAAKDLAAVNKVNFKVGDVYHIIYQVSGSSLEWFYGNFNSTMSYVYELRDTGRYGFVLPPQFILPSGKELFASIQRILMEYLKL